MPENRLAERADFFAQVDVIHPGAQTPRRVWGKDLSDTGMFLQASNSFKKGDRIALRFDVDGVEVRVGSAEVVWVRPFEPISVDGQMPGVGIKFLSIEPEHRDVIRRYVGKEGGVDDEPRATWVSMPPLTEEPRIAPLPPSSLSLPPTTPTMLRELRRGGDTMELVSLPPFTMPPADAPVPAPPPLATQPRDEEHPLTGWRFAKENDTLPEREALPDGFTTRFDDEGPAQPQAPLVLDSTPPKQAGVVGDGEPLPEAGRLAALDQAFVDGGIAVADLPSVDERLPHPAAKRPATMPIAFALIGVGTALGALYGLASGDAPPTSTSAAATAAHAPAAPEPVAPEAPLPVAQVDPPLPLARLVDGADRAAAPVEAARPSTNAAATAGASPTAAAPDRAAHAQAPATPAPPERVAPAAGAEPPLPRKAAPPEPAPPPAAKASAAKATPAVVADGRLAVPFPKGAIAKVFTLQNPTRVVVDVKSTAAPPSPPAAFAKGVVRLRTGRPTPDTLRLVVELQDGAKARAPKASFEGDHLVVAW